MLLENLRLALRSLASNKTRAALTMLGITIGVAAVITLLSVGEGVSRYIAGQFEGLGTNLVFVFPGQFEFGSGPPGRTRAFLTDADAEALADPVRVPDAAAVVPLLRKSVLVTAGNRDTSTTLRGVSEAYMAARNHSLAQGRFLSAEDQAERARVVVLGPAVAEELFPPDVDPLGRSVRVNGIPFRVIGILNEKGGSAFGNEDDAVMVPLATALARLESDRTPSGEYRISIIMVQGRDPGRATELMGQVQDTLRERHRIPFRGEDDFTVVSEEDLVSAFAQITGVLTVFLGAIAGISLLVGGIGIMNIMLVSVTERTREIGLRKAVGAKRGVILQQFLIESTVLSMAGGLVGVALGMAGAWGIGRAVPELDTAVTLPAVLLATGFAAAVGLFFGIYPATRAAGLRPMDALRYE